MIKLQVNMQDIPLKFITFSAGERQVSLGKIESEKSNFATVTAFIQSSDEIIDLLLLNDALQRSVIGNLTKNLYLPYTPFGRQDRVMNEGEALSISVFANLLNSMQFNRVTIEDPHSDVQSALIHNVQVTHQHEIVNTVLGDKIISEKLLLVSPDAGAMKKTQKLAEVLKVEMPVIGYKVRDTLTGSISGTGFIGEVVGRDVLIVDDCIDGGYTFIKLGEALKQAGAKSVKLWVTHGIFSKGVDVLSGYIDEVYCKNIWIKNVESSNTYGILKVDL